MTSPSDVRGATPATQHIKYADLQANLDAYLLQATEREIIVESKSGQWVTIRPYSAPISDQEAALGERPFPPHMAKDHGGASPGRAEGVLPWEDA